MAEFLLGLLGLMAVTVLWLRNSKLESTIRQLTRELDHFREAGRTLEQRMWSLEQWARSRDEQQAQLHHQLGQHDEQLQRLLTGQPSAIPPVEVATTAGAATTPVDAEEAPATTTDEAAVAKQAPAVEQLASAPTSDAEQLAADAQAPTEQTREDTGAEQASATAEEPTDNIAALAASAAARQNPYIDAATLPASTATANATNAGGSHAGPPHAGAGHTPQAAAYQGHAQQDHKSSPPARARIDLEQWLGVRGAAALGALLLVLAGVYFFQYSIEHNLIPPAVRVAIGTMIGIGCIAGAELRLRKRYEVLSNWLSGAGAAVLYLSFWASTALYALTSPTVAGVLMVLVTATCCVLTIKRGSMAIGTLGLMGGFATPLLLSTGSDRPVALFGYLLLLDAALLFVAQRRRWPLLALASLLGTAGYQAAWVGFRMGPERVGWGMLLTVVFGALYAAFSIIASKDKPTGDTVEARNESENDQMAWRLAEVAGVLIPFVFALYFSLHAEMLPSLPMLQAYLGILVVGASAVGIRGNSSWLPAAAATSTLGVLAGWLMTHPINNSTIMQLCIGAIAFSALSHAPLEHPKWAARSGLSVAAPIWLLGMWALTLITALGAPASSPWWWLASWTLLSLISVRQAEKTGRDWLQITLPIAWMLSLLVVRHHHLDAFGQHASSWFSMLLVMVCALLQAGFLLAKRTRVGASHAASLAALLLLIPLWAAAAPPLALAAATVLLAAMAAIACTRHGVGVWAFVTALGISAVLANDWYSRLFVADGNGVLPYATHALTAILLSIWPLALNKQQRESRAPWRSAAGIPWLFFLPMLALHERLYGLDVVAPLPLAMALIPLFVLLLLKRLGPKNKDIENSAVVWLAGSCLMFVTVAIPLQLNNEWITIGWAAQGVALLLLWRRRDHAGLKWFAIALLATVTVRLVGNPWVLDYHPRSSMRVFNWISYSYLVPSACLLLGARLLSKFELARLRPNESFLVFKGEAVGWKLLVLGALTVIFVWLNLTIIDWYAPGRMLELDLHRLPARDLTMSISWGIYALSMLAIGVWRKSSGLRKLSLVLLLATCGKVFLYDLSHLRELYRVMSLAGLAVSLIVVSLSYQRFVFSSDEEKKQ